MRRMADYEPLMRALLDTWVESALFHSSGELQAWLTQHPKTLVVFNHATPLSWLPAIALMTRETLKAGGGDRVPRGIVDRFFYQVPGLRQVGHYVSQSPKPLNFQELVENFRQAPALTDLVVFPEGSNCFVEDVHDLQSFRSVKFIELAIRTEVPLLLCLHRGSEHWAQSLELPTWLRKGLNLTRLGLAATPLQKALPLSLVRKAEQEGRFNLPLWPKRITQFQMRCELWTPQWSLRDWENLGPEERQQALHKETEILRTKMQDVLKRLS